MLIIINKSLRDLNEILELTRVDLIILQISLKIINFK